MQYLSSTNLLHYSANNEEYSALVAEYLFANFAGCHKGLDAIMTVH